MYRISPGLVNAIARCGVLTLFFCAHAALAIDLPPAVTSALQRAQIPETAIALYVQDVAQNTPSLLLNAERAMNPASVMKLITTDAALEVLGPAYRWKTDVYSTGTLKNQQLKGDLIFKGHGDPKITLEAFWLMLRDLRQKGLQDIRGNLVLDRSYFELAKEEPGAFDNEPYKPYNVAPDALLVNFRAHRVRFLAQNETAHPRIVLDPEIPEARIVNQVRLTSTACGEWQEKINYQVGSTLSFSGEFPIACDDGAMNLILQDNNTYFGTLFKQLWTQLGGTWRGSVVTGSVVESAKRIGQYVSPPLAEIIRDINKYSNNVMARQVFLTLGAEVRGAPGTPAKGAEAINDWLAVKGQQFLELTLDNGSGLSRTERISAQHLAWVLRAAYHSTVFAEFESSLPIVAADGTMKKRLVLSAVSGHAHIKTGSLKDVRALAGYVLDAQGRQMVVVCIINHPNAELGRAAQDALLEWVFGRP
jgi:D-alanyl-D-alanine carboxypeptidase/D-alanyl-D-alanine-endopeptidase (penicillin-binding protein 4)